jgi:hypothetical protein
VTDPFAALERFRWLLAMARARKIREGRPTPEEAIDELYEILCQVEPDYEWTSAPLSGLFEIDLPDWDVLEAESRAAPDPATVTRLPREEREAVKGALDLLEKLNMGNADKGEPQRARRPGPKSRWRSVVLESVTKRIAAGESLRSIERDTGVRHQRLSELRARGIYWDADERRLRTPPGTTRQGGWVIVPPPR